MAGDNKGGLGSYHCNRLHRLRVNMGKLLEAQKRIMQYFKGDKCKLAKLFHQNAVFRDSSSIPVALFAIRRFIKHQLTEISPWQRQWFENDFKLPKRVNPHLHSHTRSSSRFRILV